MKGCERHARLGCRDWTVSSAWKCEVLINFDFPMTLQLYLYRIQKRTDSDTHVYTFFSPHDVRHANSLVMVLEGARQKVPDALKKMKEQVSSVENT